MQKILMKLEIISKGKKKTLKGNIAAVVNKGMWRVKIY